MTRRSLLLLLALFACAPAPTHAPRVAPPPQLGATAVAQRVVLVSFDGLGADQLAAQSDLAAFDALQRDGATARIVPVSPTATSSTHVSILTGATPNVHGIVGNRFHIPGTPPDVTAHGLEETIEVETFVEAARRQGKRVGSLSFPTIDARTSRRTSDFGFAWTNSATMPRTIHLGRSDFHREWVPPTWTARPQRRVSYSPIMRARVDWSVPQTTRADVDVVAYDRTNDAAENYDLFLVESGESEIVPDAHGWFAIATQTPDGTYGSWSKMMNADATLADVTLYWGAISRTNAWPESYRAMIDAEVGFWPGVPDERRETPDEIFIDQINRLADFLTRAQVLTIQQMPFDLLLAYQPEVDTASHTRFNEPAVIRAAFVAADHAVSAIRAALDPSRDALVVTGDHGLAPVETEVRLNRLLADHDFAPRWRAYATGNVGHLYRFDATDDADAVIAVLNATGLFEEVTKKTGASHRNSGDIIAFAKTNVLLSPSSDAPAIAKAMSAANHGALNTHRELHSLLFAIGAGTPRGPLGEISQTRIARFVSQLLGIQPPAAAE
jgi:hypothetical protein